MSSRIWIVNLVLAIAVVLLGIKAYGVWSRWEQKPLESSASQKPLPLKERKISVRTVPPETEYEVVAGNNLFSPNRNEVGAQPAEPPPETKTEETKATGNLLKVLERAHQQMNLYGVVIVDNQREVLIDLIPAKPGPSPFERSVERARIGDTLGMFKVKEIGPTFVVLTAGGYEWQVALFDKDKPKKRVPVKKEDGPIVVGSGSEPKAAEPPKPVKSVVPPPAPAIPAKAVSEKPENQQQRTLPVPAPTGSDTMEEALKGRTATGQPGPDKR